MTSCQKVNVRQLLIASLAFSLGINKLQDLKKFKSCLFMEIDCIACEEDRQLCQTMYR